MAGKLFQSAQMSRELQLTTVDQDGEYAILEIGNELFPMSMRGL
jgi:hypothetical protein